MSEIVEKPVARLSEASSADDPNAKRFIPPADCEECAQNANHWTRIRQYIREPAAEFFGTMLLVLFGCGGNCQAVLSSSTAVTSSPKGTFLSLNFGWAVGIGLGVWASGTISGGHINPAVTLALASVRNFPWKKVPCYVLAQLLGGICGAGIVYANYYHAINAYEGGAHVRTVTGTAGLFGTFAADYMSNVSCFFSEFLGAAMLIIGILIATDKQHGPTSPGLVALAIAFTLLGIGVSLGMETGYAINPARDLGPRILTAMVGYGKAVFDFRNQYWLWCPIFGPILGMQIGALTYDALVYTGGDSLVNKPGLEAEKRHIEGCAHHRAQVV